MAGSVGRQINLGRIAPDGTTRLRHWAGVEKDKKVVAGIRLALLEEDLQVSPGVDSPAPEEISNGVEYRNYEHFKEGRAA